MNFIQNIINTFEKLKLCGLNVFPMANTLRLLRNFIIAFKARWEMYSAEKSNQNFRNFQLFYYVRKKINSNYLINLLVVIFSSCADVIFSEDFTLFDRRDLPFSRTSYYYLSHLFHLNFRNNLL